MRLFLALLALAFCTPALADEPDQSLPPVVVTATRVPTPDDRHPGRRHRDRPADHRDARLQHAGRCACRPCRGCASAPPAAPAAMPACSSAAPTPTTCWCCATACRSTTRRTGGRVQFRRRYAGRRRAHRDHPRPDGGIVRLGCDRRRDQPDHAPRHRARRALGRRPVRRLPGANPRQRRGVRRGGSGGLRADPRSAVAARLRHHAATRIHLHGRAAGISRRHRHAEPRLYGRSRHAGVAVAARAAMRSSDSTNSAIPPSTTPTPPATTPPCSAASASPRRYSTAPTRPACSWAGSRTTGAIMNR